VCVITFQTQSTGCRVSLEDGQDGSGRSRLRTRFKPRTVQPTANRPTVYCLRHPDRHGFTFAFKLLYIFGTKGIMRPEGAPDWCARTITGTYERGRGSNRREQKIRRRGSSWFLIFTECHWHTSNQRQWDRRGTWHTWWEVKMCKIFYMETWRERDNLPHLDIE
jgi:hypothetical protein